MSKILTYERKDPGCFQYGSLASRQELVEKLGRIEHESSCRLSQICDRCNRLIGRTEDESEEICDECGVTKLAGLIGL